IAYSSVTGLARSRLHIASTCWRTWIGSVSVSSIAITLPWRTSPTPPKPRAARALPIALPCGSRTPGLNVTCTRTFMYAGPREAADGRARRRSGSGYDVTPRRGLRHPSGKAQYRRPIHFAAGRQRAQRARHRAVAIGAKPHRRARRLVGRRPRAAEQGLPRGP